MSTSSFFSSATFLLLCILWTRTGHGATHTTHTQNANIFFFRWCCWCWRCGIMCVTLSVYKLIFSSQHMHTFTRKIPKICLPSYAIRCSYGGVFRDEVLLRFGVGGKGMHHNSLHCALYCRQCENYILFVPNLIFINHFSCFRKFYFYFIFATNPYRCAEC